jgi:beta-galactosidase
MSLVKKNIEEFLYGVCYYPEHWEDEIIEDDLKRIKEAGLNVIRMGEFAWSKYEVEEGVFNFDFLISAVELASKYDLKVILGTPTATPPAWLTKKYPESLAVTYDRKVMHHGSRQHVNHTSKKLRELSKRIVRKMAEEFKDYDNVIGWQIDNELNCGLELSYADSDAEAFRKWLKNKYGSLKALNKAWGNVFWSLEFTDWEQVSVPKPTPTKENPSLLLDYRRFYSDMTIEFSNLQTEILREVTPDKFITHNGLFNVIDYDKYIKEGLDFLSYDSYPHFGERNKVGDGKKWSRNLSRVRGYDNKFIVMEQASGPGGQVDYLLPTPEPGQLRLWSYQSIAHGAFGILHFRWRTCPYGAEELWHGILDYDNQDNRRLKEVKQLAAELNKFGDIFLGAETQADVAILSDFDNKMNDQIETYIKSDENEIYQGLRAENISVDIISDIELIDNYQLVFCPRMMIIDDSMLAKLKAFAKAGGTLVFTARSGIKDKNNHYYRQEFPGKIRELAGISIRDFTVIPEKEYEQGIKFDQELLKPEQFVEVIEPDTAQSIANYTNRYYNKQTAISENSYGAGKVIYYGSFFNKDGVRKVIKKLKDDLNHHKFGEIPEEVEVVKLLSGNKIYYLLLNYSDQAVRIDLDSEYINLLTEKKVKEVIEKYEVVLIKMDQ